MTNNEILLHLSLIPSVGPVLIQKIMRGFGHNLHAIYQSSAADFIARCSILEKNAHILVNGLGQKELLEKELFLLQKHSYQYVTINDAAYPALLKEIYAPPVILYYGGTLPSNAERTLAVVGSRQADNYGQRVIEMLVPDLVRHDLSIVSGGARGADTMAHVATLNASGKTYAIIGSGLLNPYPAINEKLFERIAQSGAVISPFALSARALPGNFPARNRIISGMSCGTLVVQAAESSGAAITAFFALEQGREVFAVPGRIDNELSKGCHKLLQQGATLVGSVEDILQQFGATLVAQTNKKNFDNQAQAELSRQNQKGLYTEESIEYRVIQACARPCSFDDLVQKIEVDVASLHTLLVDLQLQGLIEQQLGGLWAAI